MAVKAKAKRKNKKLNKKNKKLILSEFKNMISEQVISLYISGGC